MAEKEKPYNLGIKLDLEKDSDIIEFMKDKPNAYILKLALRRFINESKGILSEVPEKKPQQSSSDEGSDLLNGF
jgi:hypothetical protein